MKVVPFFSMDRWKCSTLKSYKKSEQNSNKVKCTQATNEENILKTKELKTLFTSHDESYLRYLHSTIRLQASLSVGQSGDSWIALNAL